MIIMNSLIVYTGTRHISKCAKEIIQAAMPIQCVEATFLAIYLSSILTQVDRIPLSFKSRLIGTTSRSVFRHIVLVVRYQNKFGALGISRRSSLMWKDVRFDSLYELIMEFRDSYRMVSHELLAIYLGLPIPHDLSIDAPVKWKAVRVSMHQDDRNIEEQVNAYSINVNRIIARSSVNSALPKI